jgi:hypothetical protein
MVASRIFKSNLSLTALSLNFVILALVARTQPSPDFEQGLRLTAWS